MFSNFSPRIEITEALSLWDESRSLTWRLLIFVMKWSIISSTTISVKLQKYVHNLVTFRQTHRVLLGPVPPIIELYCSELCTGELQVVRIQCGFYGRC